MEKPFSKGKTRQKDQANQRLVWKTPQTPKRQKNMQGVPKPKPKTCLENSSNPLKHKKQWENPKKQKT